ncbi:hypothetical protein BDW59DRAFT_171996 [Aspergillus cavernicola]|uniref:Uncharacterized protein n=1 Tax=Aspergillus cavernicola TaxID=176166 RepID=A0ABR4IEC6_9EURO
MAEFKHPVRPGLPHKPGAFSETHRPYWARSQVQHAQDLLDYSPDPIEYDCDDKDYYDNHFFFPEDCSWSPPKGWELDDDNSEDDIAIGECYDHFDPDDTMIPGLPDIKMLDAEALSDLLEDNLSPPEITSIFVFATNGAIFAYASSLPSRQLRNLSATYGAAYTCYAKNASSGNLTGVNPASHPSSYVTAQSVSLGDVGSIVFELDDLVAVVTRIADKVLLAAVGPSKVEDVAEDSITPTLKTNIAPDGQLPFSEPTSAPASVPISGPASAPNATTGPPTTTTPAPAPVTGTTGAPDTASSISTITPTPVPAPAPAPANSYMTQAQLETQYEVDRSRDLERLSSLNLSTPPSTLLALESKSAALGRFLAHKLEDLESPEDF